MSAFKTKLAQFKKNHQTTHKQLKHVSSDTHLHLDRIVTSPTQQVGINQPIYICKKTKQEKKGKGVRVKSVKEVEPFVPIEIPKSPPSGNSKKVGKYFENTKECTPQNKEIEIHIEKDEKNDKECLKKLFKKIHKLTEDLNQAQAIKNKLQVELSNFKQIDAFNRALERDLVKLQGENYKLSGEIQLLKKQLKDKENEITQLKNKTPQQLVKEVVVEKPIQVQVQVPKYVQGPEKIIEIPKYIDNPTIIEEVHNARKKIRWLQQQIERQRSRARSIEKKNSVPAVIEKPVYLDKPVYIQKPMYVDRPIERQKTVEVPVQVPYEVPVYIDKPVIDEDMINKLSELEKDVAGLMKENEELKYENSHLKVLTQHMCQNVEILKKHNEEKNYEVESLLQNRNDYDPMRTINIKRKEVGGNYAQTFNPTYY